MANRRPLYARILRPFVTRIDDVDGIRTKLHGKRHLNFHPYRMVLQSQLNVKPLYLPVRVRSH